MRTTVVRPAILFAVYASMASPAHAYLDPATGSIVLQAIIGAVATWVLYSKMLAAKAKSMFVRFAKGRRAQDTE